jgi:hypothetical protein
MTISIVNITSTHNDQLDILFSNRNYRCYLGICWFVSYVPWVFSTLATQIFPPTLPSCLSSFVVFVPLYLLVCALSCIVFSCGVLCCVVLCCVVLSCLDRQQIVMACIVFLCLWRRLERSEVDIGGNLSKLRWNYQFVACRQSLLKLSGSDWHEIWHKGLREDKLRSLQNIEKDSEFARLATRTRSTNLITT